MFTQEQNDRLKPYLYLTNLKPEKYPKHEGRINFLIKLFHQINNSDGILDMRKQMCVKSIDVRDAITFAQKKARLADLINIFVNKGEELKKYIPQPVEMQFARA